MTVCCMLTICYKSAGIFACNDLTQIRKKNPNSDLPRQLLVEGPLSQGIEQMTSAPYGKVELVSIMIHNDNSQLIRTMSKAL